MMPFHEWKAKQVKADSAAHGVLLYFRPYSWYHKAYGSYVNKQRAIEAAHGIAAAPKENT